MRTQKKAKQTRYAPIKELLKGSLITETFSHWLKSPKNGSKSQSRIFSIFSLGG